MRRVKLWGCAGGEVHLYTPDGPRRPPSIAATSWIMIGLLLSWPTSAARRECTAIFTELGFTSEIPRDKRRFMRAKHKPRGDRPRWACSEYKERRLCLSRTLLLSLDHSICPVLSLGPPIWP
ncbi:hypothetical protein BJX96DRAFT_131784 [Aspergillus floccosus]